MNMIKSEKLNDVVNLFP